MTLGQKSVSSHRWGDYYMGGRQKRPWLLEVLHTINQMVPSFSEIFDQETFYMFALLIVILSFVGAFLLARVFGIKLKEHEVVIDRPWRDWRPANPFKFPWTVAKEFQEKMQKARRLRRRPKDE